jgi:hypothetical protein
MRERDIEKKMLNAVRKMGGEAFKWVSPGNDGVPDRIVMLPGGRLIFVELKADRGRLSPVQKIQIRRIQKLGQDVEVVQGMDGLEEFLERIRNEVHTA